MLIWSKNSKLFWIILNYSLISFYPEHSFSTPRPPTSSTLINYCVKLSIRVWSDILMLTIYLYLRSRKRSDPSANTVFCFVISIKKPTYCQLLTSFRGSNRIFVDVFIECVAWSYCWTWFVLPIIFNLRHFSFLVFYFNISYKISSTPPRLLNFQFSNAPSIRHWRVG